MMCWEFLTFLRALEISSLAGVMAGNALRPPVPMRAMLSPPLGFCAETAVRHRRYLASRVGEKDATGCINSTDRNRIFIFE